MKAKGKAVKQEHAAPPQINVVVEYGNTLPLKDNGKYTFHGAIAALMKKKIQVNDGTKVVNHKVMASPGHRTEYAVRGPAIVLDYASHEAGVGIKTLGMVDFLKNYYGCSIHYVSYGFNMHYVALNKPTNEKV